MGQTNPHQHLLALSLLCTFALLGCEEQPSNRLSGYVEGESIRVASSGSGQLLELSVERGETVTAGQPLFALEQSREESAVAEANARLAQAQAQAADLESGKRPSEIATVQAGLESAQASLRAAQAELKRQRELIKQKFLPAANLDTYVAQRDAAAAKVRELQAQLKTTQLAAREEARRAAYAAIQAAAAALKQAQWQLAQKRISAPVNGLVEERYYRPGEWVPAGSPVVSLLPAENRKVRFFVPEPKLGGLEIGQRLTASCDGCPRPLYVTIDYIAPQSEYTPPVIYSRESRSKLVVMVEARPRIEDALLLKVGQPVDIELPGAAQ